MLDGITGTRDDISSGGVVRCDRCLLFRHLYLSFFSDNARVVWGALSRPPQIPRAFTPPSLGFYCNSVDSAVEVAD